MTETTTRSLIAAAGDALLIAATGRLLECVRREDTVARLGGDEFTVLLEDMGDPSDAARMAERIGEALRKPFELGGQAVTISSSSCAEGEGEDRESWGTNRPNASTSSSVTAVASSICTGTSVLRHVG